jgi:hypothetical protein
MIINIDTDGRIELIAHAEALPIMEQGITIKRRASHVEPVNPVLRMAFHAIRRAAADDSALAAWTRSWRCLWRVAIVGGPVLEETWRDRLQAIAAEVAWLERNRFGA